MAAKATAFWVEAEAMAAAAKVAAAMTAAKKRKAAEMEEGGWEEWEMELGEEDSKLEKAWEMMSPGKCIICCNG
jgi:hypothetical protein